MSYELEGDPRPTADGSLPPVTSAVAEAFLARSDDLMLLFDADGTITWASPSARRLFATAPADLVGRNGFDMIHPDDQGRAFAAFSGIPALGDQVRVELRIIDPEGRCRWVEEVVTNLLDEPEVGGMVGHIRDITERRETGDAIQFQAAVLAGVGQAVTARDLDGITTYWNAAAADLFGWTADEVLGRRQGDFISPGPGYEGSLEASHQAHLAGRPWFDEVSVVVKGGRTIHVRSSSTPIFDGEGRLTGTITASTDLTEILDHRQRIEDDNRRMADAQASAHLGSFELDLATGEFRGSDEFWRVLGRPPSLLGAHEHVHPDDQAMFRAAFEAAAEGRSDVACTHRIIRPDGQVRWVISRSSQFHSADAMTLGGTVLDITERHEAEQAILHQATHDPLTGLPNRRLFMDELDAALARSADDTGGIGVVFVDLDDFKTVNDRIGHFDADEVLRIIGARIAAIVPGDGMVGRLGGDEFVISVGGARRVAELWALIDEVHAAIREPVEINGATLVLDASIGAAVAGGERRANVVLHRADTAMYAAKQGGGRRAELFDDVLDERDRRRSELVADLRSALDAGGLITYFQPELDLATGALFGFEALARWPHHERGMVGPDEFIPLAEEFGLIPELGRQVLESACLALAGWNELAPARRITVGVNVSVLQLADPMFPDDVLRIIEHHAVDPGQICLEVTESALMDVETASAAIGRLRSIGVLIAIDDFGTGYSSFGRLKQLPVDFLKIDRSFVADIGQTQTDDVIAATMVALAQSLGVQTIAEGIETDAQRRFLADLGCEFGQGYLWHRPLPAAEATALIAR